MRTFRCYTHCMIGFKRLHYYVMCVSAFALSKKLNEKDAFNYLDKFGGINFLEECYDAEHTLSLDDAVDDLTTVCRNNGGTLE